MNDLLICSSVVGSFNIMDIPYGVLYIAQLAAELNRETLPEPFGTIAESRIDSCHFEFPDSTHAIRVRTVHNHTSKIYPFLEYSIHNTTEAVASGGRSLKVTANRLTPREDILIYKKTYYRPADFYDSRYDPSFSLLVYPGQTIHGSIYLPSCGTPVQAGLYARDTRSGRLYRCPSAVLDDRRRPGLLLRTDLALYGPFQCYFHDGSRNASQERMGNLMAVKTKKISVRRRHR